MTGQSLFEDLSPKKRDDRQVISEILARLPDEHDTRGIDLNRELRPGP